MYLMREVHLHNVERLRSDRVREVTSRRTHSSHNTAQRQLTHTMYTHTMHVYTTPCINLCMHCSNIDPSPLPPPPPLPHTHMHTERSRPDAALSVRVSNADDAAGSLVEGGQAGSQVGRETILCREDNQQELLYCTCAHIHVHIYMYILPWVCCVALSCCLYIRV